MSRRGEAPDVADGGLQGRRCGDVDAGDRHQPAHIGVFDDAASDLAVEPSELAVEEVQLAQRAIEGQLLIIGHADRLKPRAPLGPEQIADLRDAATRLRCSTAWASFLTCVRRLTTPRRRAISRRSARVRSSGTHTTGTSPAASSSASTLRVELVGLDLGVADRPQPLGMRQHHLGDMRRQDPGDRQRVARRLQHHPIGRRQAGGEQLQAVATRRDPARRSRRPALTDRHLAEIAMHVQPDEPAHHHLHSSHDNERETEDERHLRIRARGAPGQVAGAASYTIGLAAHRKRPACPSAFSQSPRPGTTATLTARPDAPSRRSEHIFMPVHQH